MRALPVYRLILLSTLLFTAIHLPAPVGAQSSNSSTLSGYVRSDSGGAIAQANVELVYMPTAALYRAFTEDDGQFLFRNLRVGGPYRLKVSHVGYGSQLRTDIFLRLLEEARLVVVLREAGLTTEEVVITGKQGDLLSTQRAGASLNVGHDQIEALPVSSASFENASRLSPYMVGGSALGFNRLYNDVSVDGLGFGDRFGLQHVEANIGGVYNNPLTLESIQEIRVDLSPFDVRRSGFTGAAVTAVTRGGTSQHAGSINATITPGWWIGRNPDDGRPDAKGYTDERASFRVGGPIVESSVFYFVAGEVTRMRMPIERQFGAPTTQGTTFSFPAVAVAQLSSLLNSAFSYDPGRFDVVTPERYSANVFARFDFELSQSQRLSLRYNFLSTASDRPPYGTTVYSSGALAENFTREHALVAELNSVLGPLVVNEFLMGYSGRRFSSTPQGTPFPFVDVVVVDRLRWWNHLTLGSEMGGEGDRVAQDNLEIRNTMSISAGKHLVSVGIQAEAHTFTSDLLSNRWGRYTFDSYSRLGSRRPQEYEYRYLRDSTADSRTKWRALQFGAFLQDEWTISSIISVSAGLRVDQPLFPDRPGENSMVHDAFFPLGYDVATSRIPEMPAMVSPRLGITINPRPDRSIQVRGGIGMFTGRVPYSWIGNLYSHTGLDVVHLKVSASAPTFVADPFRQPKPGPGSSLRETSEIVVVGKDFVLPQELRWTIALDYAFPWNIMGSLEGVSSFTRNGIVFKNINLKPRGALNGQKSNDTREIYGAPVDPGRWDYSRNDDGFTDVMYMTNAESGSSTFLTAQLQRMSDGDGLFGSLAYSIGESKDLNSGNWDNAYDQWRYNPAITPNEPRLDYSLFDRQQRITASFAYQYEWSPGYALSIGCVYTGASGMPFSYVYDGDLNGDGESLNDLFYVPGQSTEILLCYHDGDIGHLLLPTDPAYNELFSFIANDEYLSTHRRQVVERNGARTPWTHQLDARLTQSLPLANGHSLEFQAEVLNVLNLVNSAWGIVKSVPYQVVPILRFYRLDEIGRPWFEWSPRTTPLASEPYLSRWRLRVGMRYTF
ncbi:MAG: hypothetical protein H6Q31_312 [Bacteroidetes bacterium]|nr:hypothetical protein [Bacteroidota bacterium]